MPPVSQAQRRWAYATVEGKTDAKPSIGKEFLGHGIKGLPEHVGTKGKLDRLKKAKKALRK